MFTVGVYLFQKTLAVAFLVAYGSLIPQVHGLWGSQGILPAVNLLKRVRENYGPRAFWVLPTLFWWRCDDQILKQMAWAGVLLSLILLFGAPPLLILPLLWLGYFSFLAIGQNFLSFQWDILLLETTLYGFLLGLTTTPSWFSLAACWLLGFRLLFSSGVVKLRSQCPAWKSLTAMAVHYETQPLPTKMAWYLHQLPLWVAKIQTIAVLAIEIVLPFLFFLPSPLREFGAFVQIFLQILIMITGNYAFFNLLTIGLCFPLISNDYFPNFLQDVGIWAPFQLEAGSVVFTAVLATPLVVLNGLQLMRLFGVSIGDPVLSWTRKFHLSHNYGLFAMMTTVRNEIEIEGSIDGKNWKTLRFRWKPQELSRAPFRVMPHQPRLDWQMWFAALGSYKQNGWYLAFLGRLIEGSKQTSSLLAENPFLETPPRYIRSKLYRYHFTDFKTGFKTGRWWKRELLGDYAPIASLKK